MKQFRMTAFSLFAAAAVLVSMNSPAPVQDETPEEQPQKLLRRHPRANLLFDLPDDFTLAEDWQGFQQIYTESAVLISERDNRSLDTLKKAFFNPRQMKLMHRELVSSEDCTLNGLPGVKVKMTSDRENRTSVIWVAMFGDDYGSCMVLGTVFDDQGEEESAIVKHAVETVVWERPPRIDPFDHVDYTVDVKVLRVLKYAAKDEGMVMFTFGGKPDPDRNPGRPCFIVQRVDKTISKKEEREELVKQQLAEFPNLSDFKIDSLKEVEIDGLKGIEGRASGISTIYTDLNYDPMTVTLVQVTLFDEDKYYSMNGVISTIIGRNWIQMYEAGINSFARKPKEKPKELEAAKEEKKETPAPPK